jgi:hypothetical protein
MKSQTLSAIGRPAMSEGALEELQRVTFGYFLKETNPANGLVPDNTRKDSHCSITAVGLSLASYAIGVERGFIPRASAIERTLTTLRFFLDSEQSEDPHSTGYRGFYYHFLDMKTGRRARESELSTIDTTFLIAGALLAASYFDGGSAEENEIRQIAAALYRRVDWRWAQNGAPAVSHGWKPETGFLRYRWEGYSEALLLYVLGLGSPTHPLPANSYRAWTESFRWKKLYGIEFLYAGPLFIHQLSHVWIDPRGIQDEYMREKGIDYFENSRRATYVQQRYAIRNPKGFKGYGENSWGITASDGPGPAIRTIDGVERRFYDYRARGVPFGPDDGTIAPWAAIASLPFAPEIVLPAIRHFSEAHPEMTSRFGFKCSFNPTFADAGASPGGWISKGYYGLDQGPIVLMIENFRSGLPWRLMRQCPHIVTGLSRAGFRGGWLEGRTA